MSAEDRPRWNEKYRQRSHTSQEPSLLLQSLVQFLPQSGRALELAGGAGRNAIWLAQQGLDVTLADTSDVALAIAEQRATDAGLTLAQIQIDLETEPLPSGPWDLILSVHFLWRPLFAEFPLLLAPGGTLVVIQPTQSNLQRHTKPPTQFLLEDGELPQLVQPLEVIHYEEGWLAEGRHEAVIVAQQASN